MTMADLEQLLREHLPVTEGLTMQQGRASVGQQHIEWLTKTGVTDWPIRNTPICPVCGKSFIPYARQKYDTKACKQKAYRQRKNQKAA